MSAMAAENLTSSIMAAVTMASTTAPGLHVDINHDSEQEPSRLSTAVGAAIMMVFFLEGLLGNVWISVAILAEKKTWNVVNIFILSLCINDLLSLCLIVVLIIDSYIWHAWTAGIVMCKLNPEFTVAFVGCSLWHTAFIAIHRYVVVVHNLFYKRMAKKTYVIAVLVLTRAIPVSVTVPGFSMDTSAYVAKLLRCILKPAQAGRIISVTVVQILLPCVVVVLCYAAIFTFVCRTGRQMHNSNNQILQREIQITKMFGVIFLVIMLGFIPYSAVRNGDRDNQLSPDVYVVVTVFYGVATCSNPLVYGMMSTEIRTACVNSVRRVLAALPCVCTNTNSNGNGRKDDTAQGINMTQVDNTAVDLELHTVASRTDVEQREQTQKLVA